MQTAETLMVKPINHEKLLNYVKLFYTPQPGTDIQVPKFIAAYDDNVIIDFDSCYEIILDKLHDGKIQPVWDCPVQIKEFTENGYRISSRPAFYFSISFEKLLTLFDVDKCLKDFIRYEYNSLISKNTSEFLEAVNA